MEGKGEERGAGVFAGTLSVIVRLVSPQLNNVSPLLSIRHLLL